MKYVLSNCQKEASVAFGQWWKKALPSDKFFLSGAAGTGKTWLIRALVEVYDLSPIVLAPTNKACRVLEGKGMQAVTIHSAIYYPPKVEATEDGEVILNFEYEGLKTSANIVIIDEVSMIGSKVGADLDRMLNECGLPVLLIGDIHQLPPVADTRWIGMPDYEMTTLLRQDFHTAPHIIKLATAYRENAVKDLYMCDYPDLTIKRKYSVEDLLEADIILTRTHDHRRNATRRKKIALGFPRLNIVHPGEPLMILMNDYTNRFYNGQELIYEMTVELPDKYGDMVPHMQVREPISAIQRNIPSFKYVFEDFNDPNSYRNSNYTFGHATTVHKAQGSEWDTVLLLDSCSRHPAETPEEYRKWMYTAITRARKRLIIA